jgi:hypothetical protein
MKTDWSPTSESLKKLFLWLDPDSQKAVAEYERIRSRLTTFFTYDGCGGDDDHLSDMTFDRVMRKLDNNEVPEPFIGDKAYYFLGFARNIRHEHQRTPKLIDNSPPPSDTTRKELEDLCLEECGHTLEDEDRWLAVEYYRFEKAAKIAHRKKLAEQVRLTVAGLRTRVHRIREDLRPCIEKCLEKATQ